MLVFCKRPTFFGFRWNLKGSQINRAASKGKHLFQAAGGPALTDHLLNNEADRPDPARVSLEVDPRRALTQVLEEKSVLRAHRRPVRVFSVSVSESEGKGKEKLIRMK